MRSIRALLGAGVVSAAALCVFAPAAHADIIIDDWSVNQGPLRPTGSGDVSSQVTGSMWSGQRNIRVSNSDNKSGGGLTMQVSGGTLNGSFDPGYQAFVQAGWRTFGPAVDLTEGGLNDRFRLASINAPRFTLSAWGTDIAYSLSYQAGATNDTNVDLSFDAFSYYNFSTGEFRQATRADFEGVVALFFTSSTQWGEFSDSTPVSVGTISVVPTPSAAALLALGGLAAVRRRR